jgi:hypothetical protein
MQVLNLVVKYNAAQELAFQAHAQMVIWSNSTHSHFIISIIIWVSLTDGDGRLRKWTSGSVCVSPHDCFVNIRSYDWTQITFCICEPLFHLFLASEQSNNEV